MSPEPETSSTVWLSVMLQPSAAHWKKRLLVITLLHPELQYVPESMRTSGWLSDHET